MAETIISCAVTGNHTTREQHPRLPVTPQEIAVACLDAATAGAAIVHIHVRDALSGQPSTRFDLYAEVVERIRQRDRSVLINLTTGPGARFVVGVDDPRVAGPGTTLTIPAIRVEHVIKLRPDVCSIDLNTMYSNGSVVMNTPMAVAEMVRLISETGVKPELEVFDSGDIVLAKDLMGRGVLDCNSFFQIVLGVHYSAPATPAALAYMVSLLPEHATWSAFGIGRAEFPMVAQSFLLGGHVRVGLEDNIYIRKGELARDNAQLVVKAARIVSDLGGVLASPADARRILGLGV
jgi:uncharacterized protein (DUF849 family)